MEEDKELEKIKQKKLEEMMKKLNPAWTAAPIEVTDENFHDVVKKNSKVVIDCWAQWCGPCRMIAPIIEELANDYAGKILFGKLNVDENPKISAEHQIMSIPTLLIFKDGYLVDRIVGAIPKKKLEQRLQQYFT
jgi:thioredoxin 1